MIKQWNVRNDQDQRKKHFVVEVKTCTNYSKSINQRKKTFKCKIIKKKNT